MKGLLFFIISLIVTGCYRTPNLNGESIGSVAGATGGGLFAASQASGNLIIIGAGTIAGSVIGGIIGSSFDDMNRVHEPDPALWPISIDCYQTRRPAYMAKFCPGIIVPPENPDKYASVPWRDYPSVY